ncbi:MAG: mucoidy inhibitor MuiA family protein [Crocinitomicaceae bacterium]|jgi:hypothetical protein
MKLNLLFLFFVIVLTSQSFAADTLRVKSSVKNVTLYFSGAQVFRAGNLSLNKGTHFIVLEQLPQGIDKQSIQVNGMANCEVLSVKHRLEFQRQLKKDQEIKQVEEQLKAKNIAIEDIKNKIYVFELEEKLLLDNSNLNKNGAGSSVIEIKEAAIYYRARLNEIKANTLQLKSSLEKMVDDKQDIYQKLNELRSRKINTYSEILVSIECKSVINGNLTFSYFTSNAGWEPTYDFRVDEINKPLTINYNANVFQSTGENWKNVQLKLSSYDPSLSGKKPTLNPWYVGGYEQRSSTTENNFGALQGKVTSLGDGIQFAQITIYDNSNQECAHLVTDKNGQFAIKPLREGTYYVSVEYQGRQSISKQYVYINKNRINNIDLVLGQNERDLEVTQMALTNASYEGNVDGLKVRGMASAPMMGVKSDMSARDMKSIVPGSEVLLSNSVISKEYPIEIPYSINSDGEDYLVKINEVEVPVNYAYYMVPKLDKDAFLYASIANWTQLNLIPGKSNIFYQGNYVGETNIDKNILSDTLEISLGRDKQLVVNYDNKRIKTDKKMFGNAKENVTNEITVKNNKNVAINVKVEDQYPLSNREAIKIERFENNNAKVDDKDGKLTWDLKMEAGEKKSVKFSYEVVISK